MDRNQHVLIIGFVWPEPNSSAAGSRIMQLIELFKSQHWKITFASPAADSEFMVDLNLLQIDKVNIELNNKSFDVFIAALQPSIVIFDRFMMEEQFGWRVAEHCPNALRIIDTIDLHCLRIARKNALKENRPFVNDDLISDIAKREIAAILRSDLSLIISEIEMQLLISYFKVDKSLLLYLPFLLDSLNDLEICNWPSFESRTNFITIGNFLHEPNWNSALFLKEEIWPIIRKALPQAELNVYGAYPSQKVNQLHQPKEGFYIKGRAEDAKEVILKAKVLLAPLRFGAGIKGKLIDAMQCGTPNVTTDIGAESMHGNIDWSGIIANDSKSIADGAIELYTNKEKWLQAQTNGINIINTIYDKKILSKELLLEIFKLQNNLSQHRKNNFTGAMLMHHTLASTKYMAQWIEAKNNVI